MGRGAPAISGDRRIRVVTALAVVVAVLAAFHPVLFDGRTLTALPGMGGVLPRAADAVAPPVMDTSSAYIDEPLARLVGRQLAAGVYPSWNPHNGLGQPLAGNMQSGVLSPFRWPAFLSASLVVHDLALLSRLLVAALGALLLALHLGLRPLAAAGTGLGFGLTGYLVLHVNMHHLSVEVLLPALVWAALRTLEAPRPGRGAMLALLTWGTWVGGNPEATLFCALLTAAVVLARAGAAPAPWPRLGRTVAWALVGTALAGPYLLPGIEHLRHGLHHHGGLTGLDHYRPWTALALLIPGYHGGALGIGDPLPLSPPWFGTGVVLLALLGVLAPPGRDRVPRRTLALVALLVTAKGFGVPLIAEIGRLPLASMLLFHKYGLPVTALCLALLAGRGLQELAHLGRGRALGAGLALLLVGLGLHLWSRHRAAGVPGLEGLTLHPTWGLAVLGPALLLAATCAGGRRARVGAVLLLLLVGGELVLAVPGRRPERRDPFPRPPFARALLAGQRDGTPVRTVGMAGGVLGPNTGAALGIDDVRINDAVIIGRYGRFARQVIDGRMQAGVLEPGLFPPLGEEELAQAEHFIIKWYHRQSVLERGQAWRDRVREDFFTGRNQGLEALGVTHALIRKGGRFHAWMLPGRTARAWLVTDFRACADADEAEAALRGYRQLRDRPLIEDPPPGWRKRLRGPPTDKVTCTRTPEGRLAVATDLAGPRLLVLAEAWYPGRTVYVDGRPAPVLRPANLCCTAVEVPAGRHRITTRVVPRSLHLGLVVAALGLLGAGLLIRHRPGAPEEGQAGPPE